MVVVDMPNFLPSMSSRTHEGSGRSDRAGSTKGGVKAFMNGIASPFNSCWQPQMNSCAPSCGTTRYQYFEKIPAVVSPSRPTYVEHPSSPVRDVPPNHSESSNNSKTDIETPHSNDVLCGRGGSSNRHLGNMHFRELVAANKKTYVCLTKKQKMMVARKIVEMVHRTEPPGRFLAKDSDTGLWYDIGIPRSLEKTSQALREKNSNDIPDGAPSDLSVVPTLLHSSDRKVSDGSNSSKNTKNIEAPSLTVPTHLMEVYYPRKIQESNKSAHWPIVKSQFRQIEQPYLRSHRTNCPASPPQSRHVPPRGKILPFNESPSSSYFPSSHYTHQDSPPQDYRDHCDYYPGLLDHSEHYYSRYGRLQPPRRYRPYSYTPSSPSSHQHHVHQVPRNCYRQSPHIALPRGPPVRQHVRLTPPRRYYDEDRSNYGHHYPSSPSQIRRSGSPQVAYRTRPRPELSPPESRQEWKRQRNENGLVRRLSDTSLSTAVKASLSLGERTAGTEVVSPSGLLQSRSHKVNEESNTNAKVSYPALENANLTGLAVLTQAAFLQLDETH